MSATNKLIAAYVRASLADLPADSSEDDKKKKANIAKLVAESYLREVEDEAIIVYLDLELRKFGLRKQFGTII